MQNRKSHFFPIATNKKFADKYFNFRVYIYKYMFQWEKLDKCVTIPRINTFYLIINIFGQFYMCLPESWPRCWENTSFIFIKDVNQQWSKKFLKNLEILGSTEIFFNFYVVYLQILSIFWILRIENLYFFIRFFTYIIIL